MSGSPDSTIRLWDAQTGGQVGNPLQGHTSSVWSVAFSPDGRHIVSGSSDSTIRLWDTQTGVQVGNPLQGHTDSVWSVAFSSDGNHIVSGSSDKTIQLWDAQTGEKVGNPLQGHTDSVRSVAFSPDGRHIVSGSSDSTIQLWDAHIGGTTERCLPNEMLKCKPAFVAPPPICFSSYAEHALHNSQSLFLDSSSMIKDFRDLVCLQNDGWIVGPNKKLLLWIPSFYYSSFHYTPWTRLVMPRGTLELDLSRMAHGTAWSKCYSPSKF